MPNAPDGPTLKAWASAIGVVGIPGVIAFFLVYIGATELPKLVRATEAATVEVRANQKLLIENIRQMDRVLRMAQRVCINTAKDDAAKERCFDD